MLIVRLTNDVSCTERELLKRHFNTLDMRTLPESYKTEPICPTVSHNDQSSSASKLNIQSRKDTAGNHECSRDANALHQPDSCEHVRKPDKFSLEKQPQREYEADLTRKGQ